MFCSKCGNEVADGARFCPSCGAAIDDNRTDGAETVTDDMVTTDEMGESVEEAGSGGLVGLIRNNKGGLIVAIITDLVLIVNSLSEDGDASGLPFFLLGIPFSLLTGCIGWAIARKIKQHFAPDVIYYTKTSSLISSKLWWSGGIYVFCSFVGAILPAGIISAIFGGA